LLVAYYLPQVSFVGFLLFCVRHDTQAVGDPVHEIEIRDNDYSIENILIRKTHVPKILNVRGRHGAGSGIQSPSELEQGTVFFVQCCQRPVILLQGGDQGVVARDGTEKLPVRNESVVAAIPG